MIGHGKGFNLKRSWSNAGVGCGELPISLGVMLAPPLLPGDDLLDQGLLVWDPPIQTLRRQDAAECVNDFETPCFGLPRAGLSGDNGQNSAAPSFY